MNRLLSSPAEAEPCGTPLISPRKQIEAVAKDFGLFCPVRTLSRNVGPRSIVSCVPLFGGRVPCVARVACARRRKECSPWRKWCSQHMVQSNHGAVKAHGAVILHCITCTLARNPVCVDIVRQRVVVDNRQHLPRAASPVLHAHVSTNL